GARAWHLTIHSSRSRFAARLNSGVSRKTMKNCLISLAIRILIGVVAVVFVLAIAAAALATEAFFSGASQPTYVEVAPLLTAVVASSGVLVALLAFSRDR